MSVDALAAVRLVASTYSYLWIADVPAAVDDMAAAGFAEVEPMVAEMLAAGDMSVDEAAQATRSVATGPQGPDYRRIPAGFAPEAVPA